MQHATCNGKTNANVQIQVYKIAVGVHDA